MTPSRPTASYEDKVIKPEPPTTPPSFPRRFNLIPATPKKKRSRTITQIHPSAPLFKLQLPSAKQPLFQNLYDGGGLIKKKCEAYSTFKGQTFPLVQQPTASKSCGAGAVMMLTLGCFQKQDPQNALMTAKQFIHENADDFWRWYASCQLTRPCEIQEVLLRYFKINTEKHEISSENFDDCVQKLRASLSESNHSVMLSITHERIAGHWIILDEINEIEKTADIRDPYSGKAFRLSFDELQKNLGEEDFFGHHTQHYLQVTSLPGLDDGEVAPDAKRFRGNP